MRRERRDTNMRPSALHSPSPMSTPPFLASGRLPNQRLHLHPHLHHGHRRLSVSSTSTEGRHGTTDGEDVTLTTLRTSGIKEVRAMDRVQEGWEKELCYTFYETEVCELMGLMHLCLTRTRPRLAIGIMVTLHVPTSVLVAAMHVVDAALGILGELNF